MTFTNTQLAEKMAYALRTKRWRASIIDYDPERAGYVLVKIATDQGVLVSRSVRMKAVMQMLPGAACLIGYDYDRELAVLEPDFSGQVAAGMNPAANNPADRMYFGPTNQESIQTLYSHPQGTNTDPSMIVVTRPWFYVRDNVWHFVVEQTVDLTSSVPATVNHHCLAAIWIKPDDTVEVTESTSQELLEALDMSDVQECQAAATVGSVPVRFWRLYKGQTSLKESDSWMDGRQFINTGAVGGRRQVRTLTTGTHVLDTYDDIVLVDATGGAVDITLPAANAAFVYTIKRLDGTINAVTVSPPSGTIDGSASLNLATQWTSFQIANDGSDWYLITEYT